MKIGTAIPTKYYELAAQMGYDYVEFPGVELCKLTEEEVAALEERVKKTGLRVLGMNSYCDDSVVALGRPRPECCRKDTPWNKPMPMPNGFWKSPMKK